MMQAVRIDKTRLWHNIIVYSSGALSVATLGFLFRTLKLTFYCFKYKLQSMKHINHVTKYGF